MNRNNPKVSVVIPVYKVELYVAQCIESVLQQTYGNLEIILVNDGSGDSSGEICDQYATKDARVKVWHQPNLGGCFAMQKGVDLATGEFLMFLDGDDWVDNDALECAVEAALESNADAVLWSRVKEFHDRSIVVPPVFPHGKVFVGNDLRNLRKRFVGLSGSELRKLTETDAISPCWGKLFRLSVFKNNPHAIVDVDGNQNFDALINVIVFKDVKTAVYLGNPFNHYRRYNVNSITKNHGFGLLDKYLAMFSRVNRALQKENLDKADDFKEAYYNRVALSVINISQSITGPGMKGNVTRKIQLLKDTLGHDEYRKALAKLDMSFFPVHWKIFFWFCRFRLAFAIYMLALIMRKIR